MKNQFDLVIQDSSLLFSVDHNDFVTYVDDENTDEQGVKVRCCFTDTIAEIKEKVKKACGLEDGKEFDLIEVQRQASSYCQLVKPLSQF